MNLVTSKIVGAVDVAAVKPRTLHFLDEEHVLLLVSNTTEGLYGWQRFENSAAFVLDISTNDLRQLLVGARGLWPAQTGLGRVVGSSVDGTRLYMPAFAGDSIARYGLFEVLLNRRVERRIAKGTSNTVDWFVDAAGRPYVEEEFVESKNLHRIWVHDGNDRRLIYEKETDVPDMNPVGLTTDYRQLVFNSTRSGTDRSWDYHLSLDDGTVTGPFYRRDDADVATTLTDLNRVVYGVEYSGLMPTYEFADSELTERVKDAQDALNGSAAELIDWTPTFDRLLFRVSGGWSSGDYVIIGRGYPKPTLLVRGRPDITSQQVEPTTVMAYRTRDGVTIPALLTYRREAVETGGKLPLIVLLHGGPAANEHFGFDWIAQYFASRGYAVLQPRLRGSTGFGKQLDDLGKGGWSPEMSTDLDDSVQWLIHRGVADPDRVAIIGANSGGYAALAAGAFSPLYYKCIVSIAGVSDLPRMLQSQKMRYGKYSWSVARWRDRFVAVDDERDKLEAISPVDHAEDFRAPVLLVHGREDTVVEFDQSERMYNALKKADKDVTFVRLESGDHSLSSAQTRLEALRAVADFIRNKL
ncbi:MAG: alpha/beta fold hydrolase [Woeseiaceae bacterium]